MHISRLAQVISVLVQQLKQYEQELATLQSSSRGRLKNTKHLSLLLIPSASQAVEPDSKLEWSRANHPKASPLVDFNQGVK